MFTSLFHKKKTTLNESTVSAKTRSDSAVTTIDGDKFNKPEVTVIDPEIHSSKKRKRQLQQQQPPTREKKYSNNSNNGGDNHMMVINNTNQSSRRNKKNKLQNRNARHQQQQQQYRNHDTTTNNKAAAIELSNKLQDLSTKKKLREALELYWDTSNAAIRDGHHASIMINCCSRCGAVEEGEKIVNQMMKNGHKVSVQANTALLKGYAHSGMILKAVRLYMEMCNIKDRQYLPNVRTFNTLARGCLWNAAIIVQGSSSYAVDSKRLPDKETTSVIGGVQSLEEAWSWSKKLNMCFDASSYEYSVIALCFALRVTEAEHRISEMKDKIQSHSDLNDSLIVCLVALARAHAMLGHQKEAQINAKAALSIIMQPTSECEASTPNYHMTANTKKEKQGATVGGKQGWKSKQAGCNSDDICNSNRSSSNAIFRNHRSSELKMDAESIARLCQSETLLSKSKEILVNLLESRLLYFCGGGTTDLNAVKNYSYKNAPVCADAARMQLLSSLWHSFGLSTAVHRNGQSEKQRKYNGGKLNKSSDVSIPDSLKDRFKSSIQQDGFIDFTHIFRPLWDDSFQPLIGEDGLVKTSQIKPIYIELGSGSGDWIVGQAVENPSVNYVAVELRADRVAQTFAKLTLNPNGSVKNLLAVPLCNLCCVGSECGVFLKDRVKKHSISKIFVNHPEPPTQTYGAEGNSILPKLETEEPAHMLNSCTLLHAAQCLKPDSEGQLIIVTDNLWYARLICLTLVKLLSQHSKVLQQTDLGSDHSLRLFQSFSVPNGRENVELYVRHGTTVHPDTKKNLQLDEKNGTSYFDRLWKAGGGKHAHKMDRYIISMQTCPKCNVVVGSETRSTIATKVSQNHNKLSNATTTATRSKRKRKARSPQKQALRNRRRLEKRSIEL